MGLTKEQKEQKRKAQVKEAYEKSVEILDEYYARFKALPLDALNPFDCIEFFGAAVKLECAVKEVEKRLSEASKQ